MPIGAITMILTNVGLQIYNNWCSSRQNARLQQKREEFERAARERNTQRMWQIMREGQELTKALEEERHRQRIDELKNDIGSLLQKLAYTATINNWPLNVLPIVMKNQALGNILANQEESIALHCIFTPSNSNDFNKFAFPRIEEALESYCNQYWSVMSEHPILFYSGAWKSAQSPTEIQIDSMRTALNNLPVLVITPFFRPNDGKLVFQIRMWGVGASTTDEFSIPEIVPTEFQRDYKINDDYANESTIIDELIEDMTPYLQCLIGYMADTYFWSSQGKSPVLPLLISNGTINTDGMKYLVNESKEYYNGILWANKGNAKNDPFMQDNIWHLYDGSAKLWDKKQKIANLLFIISLYNGKILGDSNMSLNGAFVNKTYCSRDLSFLMKIEGYEDLLPPQLRNLLHKEIDRLTNQSPLSYSRCSFPQRLLQVVYIEELNMEEILHSFETYCNDMGIKNQSILICCVNPCEYHFHTYDEEHDKILYYDVPFNFSYKTRAVKHQRSVNGLFSGNATKQLSCQQSRIWYLIEKINNTALIY